MQEKVVCISKHKRQKVHALLTHTVCQEIWELLTVSNQNCLLSSVQFLYTANMTEVRHVGNSDGWLVAWHSYRCRCKCNQVSSQCVLITSSMLWLLPFNVLYRHEWP